MADEKHDYAKIVKNNIKNEWEANRPRDWRDGAHMLTDGWLEPFERMKGGAPAWLLIGGVIFAMWLFLT